MLIVFFVLLKFLAASLTDSDKAIVLKTDSSRILVSIGKTIRLRTRNLPDRRDDEGVFRFIEAQNGYYIKFKDGLLCKSGKDSAGVTGCQSEADKYTVWKVNMAGESGAQIETTGNLCLLPTGLDNREKTKGRYMQAKPCTDETYLWEIVDLEYPNEEFQANKGDMMVGNTDWDGRNVDIERIHHMYDAHPLPVEIFPKENRHIITSRSPDAFHVNEHSHVAFENS
ncbi:hypothetical protein THOM_1840 [Trachipleistophora hominis]|uniref:Ricin B lectin domain-containing protein n=1 Tax=Trachipleistophora hominis TaxID=72359 RepID=L7JWX0_TRAHO|nr:hypothetical protein THOM_1840 [Trachipleistophora hominis]